MLSRHLASMCAQENIVIDEVQDDPKLLGDSGEEVPNSEWSGWRFDSRCEIFSLFDKKTSLGM